MTAGQRRPDREDETRRRSWGPFRAEVMATASLATWGLWALCLVVLVALVGALAVAAARVIF